MMGVHGFMNLVNDYIWRIDEKLGFDRIDRWRSTLSRTGAASVADSLVQTCDSRETDAMAQADVLVQKHHSH
jgi:hypothetical protein